MENATEAKNEKVSVKVKAKNKTDIVETKNAKKPPKTVKREGKDPAMFYKPFEAFFKKKSEEAKG